jgi:NADH-quinone oxidoreductase subunit J
MLFSSLLFNCFSSLALLSSLLVILSRNPVYSVLYLILTFCNASALLLLLELELLPVVFIVVYVGAVAVLFLFVIMMLNLKISELKSESHHFLLIGVIVFILALNGFLLIRFEFSPLKAFALQEIFVSDYSNRFLSSFNDLNQSFDCKSNTSSISSVLFTNHYDHFIVTGYILLLAMVGSILLTLQKKFLSKSQNAYWQVLRSFQSSVSFYN